MMIVVHWFYLWFWCRCCDSISVDICLAEDVVEISGVDIYILPSFVFLLALILGCGCICFDPLPDAVVIKRCFICLCCCIINLRGPFGINSSYAFLKILQMHELNEGNFKTFKNYECDLSQKWSESNMWLLVNHTKPTKILYWK